MLGAQAMLGESIPLARRDGVRVRARARHQCRCVWPQLSAPKSAARCSACVSN
jgi:hypothetical protein